MHKFNRPQSRCCINWPGSRGAERKTSAATIEKAPQPKLSKRDCDKFMSLVAGLKLDARGTPKPRAVTAMTSRLAIPGTMPERKSCKYRTVCKAWNRDGSELVLYALKFWGYQVEAEGEA